MELRLLNQYSQVFSFILQSLDNVEVKGYNNVKTLSYAIEAVRALESKLNELETKNETNAELKETENNRK